MGRDKPYVRLQLDIMISKVFTYHLLNHWVITTAKLHNLSAPSVKYAAGQLGHMYLTKSTGFYVLI